MGFPLGFFIMYILLTSLMIDDRIYLFNYLSGGCPAMTRVKDKKYHYTYLIETACGKKYIGYRSSDVEPHLDGYMGSPVSKETRKLVYAETSRKIILGIYSTRKEAAQAEIDLHNQYDVAVNPLFLNRAKSTTTGFSTYGTTHTPETRQHLSEAHKGKKLSPETRQRLSEARKGKKRSPETRQRLSEAHKGKNKGTTLMPETKKKISEKLKGKKLSPEHRHRLSEACKGKQRGKNNPMYDSTIYTFYNTKTGEIVSDTKCNFYTERGLCRSHLNSVIKGKCFSHKGWTVLK